MGDLKMNEARLVQDVDYITGTLTNGDFVRISKTELANLIKGLIPTFGYTTYYPESDRWKRILNMNLTGEYFLSFLYSGGSYTNAESCCLIVNIMKGAQKQVVVTRISGNNSPGQVFLHYKFDGDNLKIWIYGTYSAAGGALINLSSKHLPFEMLAERPPSDSIKA